MQKQKKRPIIPSFFLFITYNCQLLHIYYVTYCKQFVNKYILTTVYELFTIENVSIQVVNNRHINV